MDPLYWPQPGCVQFQLWYLEVPGLLVTTLQFCIVQCYKEIPYLLQNKMSTCDMCSAWSCFNSRESGFAVTNENKITPKRTNILRIYPGWSLRCNTWFQFMWDSTMNWYSSSIVHIFVLLILFESLPEPLMIDSDLCTKNNGNNFLTLEQLHTFFKLFFFEIVILFSNTVHYGYDISPHKKVTSQRPQTSKNSLGPVKICDGQVKFKHGYRETRIWN